MQQQMQHEAVITQQDIDASTGMQAALQKVKLGKVNGVNHELTCRAFEILMDDLTGFGNALGDMQREALFELLGSMTKYAQGTTSGRRAFNLATGCGKTSAIIAWVTAAFRLGLDNVSIAVAASRVDALCSIKAALLMHGVPEELIGLKYSNGIPAELPSTGGESRRFQLVTHSRVRGGNDAELFTHYNGQKRALLIYDETLWKSDSVALADKAVRKALASYREHVRDSMAGREGMIDYLSRCVTKIGDALLQQRADTYPAGTTLVLPMLSPVALEGYLAILGKAAEWEPLRELLRLSSFELRLLATQQGEGVLWYSLRVPPELTNVLILDASYPIRTLARLDNSIVCDSKYANKEVKRFDRVSIHQMLAFGGRNSMLQSFGQIQRDKRDVSREVIEVVKSKPATAGILIFTFKARPRDGTDIGKVLKEDMRSAGIDLDAKLPDGRPRLCFMNWGDETSRNDASYCTTVIMAGLLHRAHLDLASAIVGQAESLTARVDNKLITDMLNGELDHSAYQAMSRGACRIVDQGQARQMDCYLIHKDIGMRKRLRSVIPGAVWREWVPVHRKPDAAGATARAALRIMEALEVVPIGCTKLSTSKLRADYGLGDIAGSTWTTALATALNCTFAWNLQGRSLVRWETE